MGNFDDVVERNKSNPPIEDRPQSKISKGGVSKKSNNSNLMELFTEEGALSELGDKLNPEMKSQVIVPLANLLDKYGVSESIVESDTTSNAINLITLLNDIAPVIKGLADYVAGQRNALAEEDKKFLDEIMKASESGDFSDLFEEDGTIEEGQGSEPISNIHPILGDISDNINQINLNGGEIDWAKVVDPDGAMRQDNIDKASGITEEYKEMAEGMDFFGNPQDINESILNMPTLEELATQAGLDMGDIQDSDTTKRGTKEEGLVDAPLDKEIKEEYMDIVNQDIMDNIMDEIVYLDDDEVDKLMEDGFELEEIDNEAEDEEGVVIPIEDEEKEEASDKDNVGDGDSDDA